uniref:Retrotransposon gag domain-containing protein n=1 Tax=Glossina palpalis gambiensis TaxID=67801 RepID=A0A1B0BTI6_9MUSC
MVKTSWSYSLRKEELSEICGSLDLDTKGTVEDMRKAMTAPIATPDLSTEQKAKLTELEAQYIPRMLQLPEGTVRGASPKCQAQERISCGAAMDRICKWSVRYDGESCALEFITLVEELCEVYDLPTDIMTRIIMELLHGKAAIWYRNNRRGLRRATELFSDAVQFIDRHFRLYFESQSQENDFNQFKVRSETITKATDDEENEIHMYDNLGVHLIFIAHCLVVFENLEHEYNVR